MSQNFAKVIYFYIQTSLIKNIVIIFSFFKYLKKVHTYLLNIINSIKMIFILINIIYI